ncbi:MAG: glycosyltransferase family 1 protein [Bacteroidetes bacterium]|nr:MAG: glycosyltransferase family 1 protein [Bacteroidota bacterium]
MTIKVLAISNYTNFHSVRPEAEIFLGLARLGGYEITIMTYGNTEYAKRFQEAGIRVIDWHPEKKFDKQEIAFIRQELISGQYDIVELFNSQAIINGIRAAKGLPVKVVLYRGYSANINWWDPTAYTKFLHPRVDKIHCNSIGVEEMFRRQLFFDKSKAVTINKGHRLEWYSGTVPGNLRKEFNIPENALLLVNVANNRRMKGIPYLLKAMNQLPESAPIHVVLIGNNMDNPKNLALLSNLKNRAKVHFAGYRKDALECVASADAFVLPSIKGESITKAVIEAMSLGVTPVISDIAGNRELVVHGENGLVFPSKNVEKLKETLLYLEAHRELLLQFGKASQERIDTVLNTDTTVAKVDELFRSLVDRP